MGRSPGPVPAERQAVAVAGRRPVRPKHARRTPGTGQRRGCGAVPRAGGGTDAHARCPPHDAGVGHRLGQVEGMHSALATTAVGPAYGGSTRQAPCLCPVSSSRSTENSRAGDCPGIRPWPHPGTPDAQSHLASHPPGRRRLRRPATVLHGVGNRLGFLAFRGVDRLRCGGATGLGPAARQPQGPCGDPPRRYFPSVPCPIRGAHDG